MAEAVGILAVFVWKRLAASPLRKYAKSGHSVMTSSCIWAVLRDSCVIWNPRTGSCWNRSTSATTNGLTGCKDWIGFLQAIYRGNLSWIDMERTMCPLRGSPPSVYLKRAHGTVHVPSGSVNLLFPGDFVYKKLLFIDLFRLWFVCIYKRQRGRPQSN